MSCLWTTPQHRPESDFLPRAFPNKGSEGLDGAVGQERLTRKTSGVQIVRLVDGQCGWTPFRLEEGVEAEAFHYGLAYLAPDCALIHPYFALRGLVGKGDPKDGGLAYQVNEGAHTPLDVHTNIGTFDVKRSVVDKDFRACLKGFDGGDRQSIGVRLAEINLGGVQGADEFPEFSEFLTVGRVDPHFDLGTWVLRKGCYCHVERSTTSCISL